MTAVCLFVSCWIIDDPPTEWSPKDYTLLYYNTWADGGLNLQKKEQWFKFTATADNQYFHFKPDTINSGVYIEPYDKKGEKLAPAIYLNSGGGKAAFVVSKWEPCYIKITQGSASTAGTYKIAFNASSSPPTD